MDIELIQEISALESFTSQLEKHQELIKEQISELEGFLDYAKELSKNNSHEILASVGKGVYAKASLTEEKLFVNVGAGVLIKKSPQEVEKVVEEQIIKLKTRSNVSIQLEIYAQKLAEMLEILKNQKPKKE